MSEVVFIVPGALEQRTGGFIYDHRLIEELERQGQRVRVAQLSSRFPLPTAADLDAAERLLADIPTASTVVIDGLAFGAMPEIAARHARRLRLIAVVHHPLGYEAGLPPLTAHRLLTSERAALAHAHRVVVTSPTTRDVLVREFAVPITRITVAEPGIEPAEPARGSGWNPPRLLYVASLTPRKDHLTLIRALAHLADLPWRLDLVGSATRDPVTARAVREAVTAFGFGSRVTFLGELEGEGLDAAFRPADLYVSSSRYEGYGMALMEAIARGLPIVATRGGAVAEVLPAGAALLVEPGDPLALAAALRRVMRDAELREEMRRAALAARERLSGWAETARIFSRILEDPLAA